MSYLFDGLDDVITTDAVITMGSLVTLYAVARPDTAGETSKGNLIATGTGTETNERVILQINTAAGVSTFGFCASRTVAPHGVWYAPNNSLAAWGIWHGFGATYDGTAVGNVPKLYLDGGLVSTVTNSQPTSGTLRPETVAYIGNNPGQQRTFEGLIGAVAAWNRVLHDSEMALVYRCGIRKVLRGLLFHYDFMRAPGVDASGNGRTCTVSGALWEPGARFNDAAGGVLVA